MPVVLITLAIGLGVGYWFCLMQMRGRIAMIVDALRQTEAERNHYRHMLENVPPPPPPEQVFVPGCTKCLSAKSVLGFNDFGNVHPPVYEGGLNRWKEIHG